MIPNYASAVILDNLVKAWNETNSTVDISNSIKQYCLGYNNPSSSFKLNYGVSVLSPNEKSQINNLIVFGKGYCTTDLTNSIQEVPNSTSTQFGFRLQDIIDITDEVSNCYMFGCAYLTSRTTGINVEFSIGKPSSNPTGESFVISKDISLDEAFNILKYSTDLVFPIPTASENYSLILCKFIIDINKFYNDYQKDRAFIYILDERKPFGYFGLTEESVYTSMISQILQNDSDVTNTSNAELDNIKNIINTWVNLDSWTPDFAGYWATADPPLPTELQNFIETYLGIVI